MELLDEKIKKCRLCSQDINENAKVCHHCGKDQRPYVNIILFAASTATLIMVIIAASQMFIAASQVFLGYQQLRESKKKRIEAEKVFSNASAMSQEAIRKAELAVTATEKAEKDAKIAVEKIQNFQRQLGPRKLTKEQYIKMVEKLKTKPGIVNIYNINGDGEASDFAEQLYNIFKEADWSATRIRLNPSEAKLILDGYMNNGGLLVGSPLWLIAQDIQAPQAHFVSYVLSENGVGAPTTFDEKLKPEEVIIWVGSRGTFWNQSIEHKKNIPDYWR